MTAIATSVDILVRLLVPGCAFLASEGQTRELSVPGTVLFLCCYVAGWKGMEFHVFLYLVLEIYGRRLVTSSPFTSEWARQAIVCKLFGRSAYMSEQKDNSGWKG